MQNSEAAAEAFVEECKFALEQLFESLARRQKALEEIAKNIKELEQAEEVENLIFQNQDQWSPHANNLYAKYLDRIRTIITKRQALSSDQGRADQLKILLARFGATEQSMAVLGGAVLQIAKQALSFRFGAKGNLPSVNTKQIGSQNITEVIWEGRNHALHWEEGEPKRPGKTMLQRLKADLGVNIRDNQNNSLEIIDVLGWDNADAVVSDLKKLVRLT
jgi:hypothetical protein